MMITRVGGATRRTNGMGRHSVHRVGIQNNNLVGPDRTDRVIRDAHQLWSTPRFTPT
jgi:hypothetical protein